MIHKIHDTFLTDWQIPMKTSPTVSPSQAVIWGRNGQSTLRQVSPESKTESNVAGRGPHCYCGAGLWDCYNKSISVITGNLLFHQDNTPALKSTAAIQECGFELVWHLPYSPDLALSSQLSDHNYSLLSGDPRKNSLTNRGTCTHHDSWTDCMNVADDTICCISFKSDSCLGLANTSNSNYKSSPEEAL